MRYRKKTKPDWELLESRDWVGGDVSVTGGTRELPAYAKLLNLERDCLTLDRFVEKLKRRHLGADRADPAYVRRIAARLKRRIDWLRQIVESLLTGRGLAPEDIDSINQYLVRAPLLAGSIGWPNRAKTAGQACRLDEVRCYPFLLGRHSPDRTEITYALLSLFRDIANANELGILMPGLCPVCGRLFVLQRRNQRFCSPECCLAFHSGSKRERGISGKSVAEYHRSRRQTLRKASMHMQTSK
jgi:hypothetical protein